MTHPAIDAMARAIRRETRKFLGCGPGNSTSDLGPPSIDEAEARRMALAALRALAACEPSEGMLNATHGASFSSRWNEAQAAHWSAMLAELVKECERDA